MASKLVDLNNESNRLSTFVGWPPSSIVSSNTLAAAGFHYIKLTDTVRCAFCNIDISDSKFDYNIDDYKRHNPNCKFILGKDCLNIPLIEGIQLRQQFIDDHKEKGELIDIRNLGVRAHRVAIHLKYSSYCDRLETFKNWKNEAQKPDVLATAGFFFTGNNDAVRCFYCNGGFKNWEKSDKPLFEHALWFPHCRYLNLTIGEKFLDESMVDRFNALLCRPRTEDTTSSTQEGQELSIYQTDNFLSDNMDSFPDGDTMTLGEFNRRQRLMTETNNAHNHNNSPDTSIFTSENFENVASVMLEEYNRREHPDNQYAYNNPFDIFRESTPDFYQNFEIIENNADSGLENFIVLHSQNEIGAPNTNEFAVLAESLNLYPFNDVKMKEDVDKTNIASKDTNLTQSDLEENTHHLKESRLCKICLDEEMCVLVLPCAHLITCITCISSIENCALCNEPIKATIRIFLS